MSEQDRSKAIKDITFHSVSGKGAGKSVAAINSTENVSECSPVSISQCSSDPSVVAGECATTPIVAAPAAPIAPVVNSLETTVRSGSSSQTPNPSFKAPFVNTAAVDPSKNSSNKTLDNINTVAPSNQDSQSSGTSEINSSSALLYSVNTSSVGAITATPTALPSIPVSTDETVPSPQVCTAVGGGPAVALSTPLSAPRRSSRARRINSRFDLDEVDENIKKFVARIAAPDSHSILQSPELAFHSPAPPPPPPPPAPCPLKAPSDQTGEQKVNAKKPQKKIVKRLQAVVEIEKCKKETIAAFSSHKAKALKKKKQDTSKTKENSASGINALESDSDDDLPLAHFTGANTSTSAEEKVLTPISSRSKILNSKSASSLPSKYSIKTIHNPELSSTPISIVCIEDPEEEEDEEDLAQNSKKKVKKKMPNENIPEKKRKGGHAPAHSKMNGMDEVKGLKKSATTKASSKVKHSKKFELEKLKNQLNASPSSTGKLLKIVNLKVVPSSLPDLSSNNVLRKLIEKNADNDASENLPAHLERASSSVPEKMCIDKPEADAKASPHTIVMKAPPKPKTENLASKYDDLKALLHADEPPLSSEWSQEKNVKSGSLPIKDEHELRRPSLDKHPSNVESTLNVNQGSSHLSAASNALSPQASVARNDTTPLDSPRLPLKVESVEVSNPSKRPLSDLHMSSNKKVKHERNVEKMVCSTEQLTDESSCVNFTHKDLNATDSSKGSLTSNLARIKVDPCDRKPDLAMVRDTRVQCESSEQEKEVKLHLTPAQQNDEIQEPTRPCSPSLSAGALPLSESAKSASKCSPIRRSRTSSPSETRSTKRIKVSPVDSKEDIKPDLLMTKIIEGTGIESKPDLPNLRPATDCSSTKNLDDCKEYSSTNVDRSFKEEPRESSDLLLSSSSSSSSSPSNSPVRRRSSAGENSTKHIRENKNDSQFESKDRSSSDGLNSSLIVSKHGSSNDDEDGIDDGRRNACDAYGTSISIDEKSSLDTGKDNTRCDKKDGQSFLDSRKDCFRSEKNDSPRSDKKDAKRSRDNSRDDKKGSSRSERKDSSSKKEKHSSNHKSSHSSRDKYHSGSSSSRSSSSSRNSEKKTERSSHKSRHESSRSRDQKSSRKDSDSRRDYDSRDRSEKDRSRKSDDSKRESHEKRDKSTDAGEVLSSSEVSTKTYVKSEILPDVINASKSVPSLDTPIESKSLNVSATPPVASDQSKDIENISHTKKEKLSKTSNLLVRDEAIHSKNEIDTSKPVALTSEIIPSACSSTQLTDAKTNVQEAVCDGASISSVAAPEASCHVVTSQSYSHPASVEMKTENNSDEVTVAKCSSTRTSNAPQVEYKTSVNLLSNSTCGSQSEDSSKGIVSSPLDTKAANLTRAVDTASPPINIAALLNLCRANIPNSSKNNFPLKTEDPEREMSPVASVEESSLSASSVDNAKSMSSTGKPPEASSPTDSLEEPLASNYDSKECSVSSPIPPGITPNSLDNVLNIEENKTTTQNLLCELEDSCDKDTSLTSSSRSNQPNSSRGQLCIRLEAIRVQEKLAESGCLESKEECDAMEECNAFDSMDVDGTVFNEGSNISGDLKVSRLPSVEETPEEKEKRLEEERKVAIEKECRNKIVVEERMKSFVHLSENLYLIDRKKSKQSKEVRRMVCDCFLTKEEISRGEKGCGEDCLNRLLMIECGWRCPLGDACLNRQFQRCDYGPIEVFNAEEKGCGVRATDVISPGTFIMEYVGEVFDQREFRRRRKDYGKDGTAHFYFMALRADQFIDATRKGNISRFVNHSCDPNAETQKWTVNGELRVGFFATKFIAVGEEINFDYRMERYGREPQKCYCGTAVCRGWLGEPPDEKTKEEKEEEKKKLVSSDKRKKEDKKHYDDELLDDVSELARVGLRNKRDTLLLSRVMVRAETDAVRVQLLTLLCAASANMPCLRLFMDYHGLSLLWSWMADLNTALQHAPLKLQILKTLDILPITNRTQVSDSRVLEMVEKWSKQLPPPPVSTTLSTATSSDATGDSSVSPPSSDVRKSSDGDGFEETDDSSQQSSDDNSKQSTDESSRQSSDDNNKRSPDENNKQMLSPDDNSSDSNSSAVKSKSPGVPLTPTTEATSNNSQLAGEEDAQLRKLQLEMVELALKLLERWQVLKEEFRIPKKQRVELMKEHEREVEAGYRRYLNTERGRRETRESRYGRSSYDSRRSKMHILDSHDKNSSWPNNDAISIMMNSEEFAGLSKEERREKFAQKVAQVDEQRRLQEGMWSVHVERCARIGLDPYQSPIVDPSGQYYWDSSNSTWVPLTPETAYAAGILSPAVAQQHGVAAAMVAGFCIPGVDQPVPYDPHAPPVMNGEVLPPLVVTIKLPPHWHIARDQLNRVYFYHNRSRQTQWEIPTNETKTSIQISDSESESSSSSSDSEEEFSSDEDEGNDDEVAQATSATASEDSEAAVEGKIIRRQRGRKKHSEALVQQRVISPIRELDRELARKERREAKERAKHEARKERHFQDQLVAPNDDDMEDEAEGNPDDLLISRVVHHPARDKVKTKSKERAATAIADNSERARKIKDLFRSRMATFIVSVLNPYRRADCKQGRINTTDDFKYLARKLTHFVMVKELKQLPSIEDLDCSESVKHKTKDFVRKYMAKYGTSFKRDPLDTKEY